MTQKLPKQTQKNLRTIGHYLDPIVTIGANGLSDALVNELTRALNDHELIKIKIPAGSSDDRKALAEQVANISQSHLIYQIGRTLILYKSNPKPNPKLSNLIRFG